MSGLRPLEGSNPVLSLDILGNIVLCAPLPVCALLMYTCRTLYDNGVKAILRGKRVDFMTAIKFLRFIQRDPPRRLSLVRQLFLHPLEAEVTIPTVLRSFVDLIPSMKGLETLTLYEGEELLQWQPATARAINTLTSVRCLTITYGGQRVLDFLRSIPSQNITSMHLDWDADEDSFFKTEEFIDGANWMEYHPVPLLSRWSGTLEELTCEKWAICPGLRSFNEVYPEMRHLTLLDGSLPTSIAFIRAFPGLTCLKVLIGDRVTNILRGSVSDTSLAKFTRRRDNNIRSQNQSASAGSTIWQSLEEFHGTILDLWVLGLICHIPRIRLIGPLGPDHLQYLPAVLSSAQPVHLKIAGSGALLYHDLHGLTALLQSMQSLRERLQSLTLAIIFNDDDYQTDVAAHLTTFGNVLCGISLRRLRLTIHTAELEGFSTRPDPQDVLARMLREVNRMWHADSEPSPPPSPPQTSLCPAELSLEHFDVNAFTERLEESIPSLVDAVVDVQGVRTTERQKGIITRVPQARIPWMTEMNMLSLDKKQKMFECTDLDSWFNFRGYANVL